MVSWRNTRRRAGAPGAGDARRVLRGKGRDDRAKPQRRKGAKRPCRARGRASAALGGRLSAGARSGRDKGWASTRRSGGSAASFAPWLLCARIPASWAEGTRPSLGAPRRGGCSERGTPGGGGGRPGGGDARRVLRGKSRDDRAKPQRRKEAVPGPGQGVCGDGRAPVRGGAGREGTSGGHRRAGPAVQRPPWRLGGFAREFQHLGRRGSDLRWVLRGAAGVPSEEHPAAAAGAPGAGDARRVLRGKSRDDRAKPQRRKEAVPGPGQDLRGDRRAPVRGGAGREWGDQRGCGGPVW